MKQNGIMKDLRYLEGSLLQVSYSIGVSSFKLERFISLMKKKEYLKHAQRNLGLVNI